MSTQPLVGVNEVADMFGVSKQRVSELARTDSFPAPVSRLAAGPVWWRSDIQSFMEQWQRKPGRRGQAKLGEGGAR